jgi:predicted PurR-regulated permease PerM
MGERNTRNLILWVFLFYFLISIVMLGWLLWPFVSTIVLAATVTGIFNPLYLTINRKLRPVTASLATCALIFCVLFVPVVFFVGIVSKEAYDLYLMARDAALSKHLNQLVKASHLAELVNPFLANFNLELTGNELNQFITDVGRNIGLFLFEQSRLITSNVLSFVVNFFLMLLITFYLFIDQHRLLTFIFNLSPLPDEQDRMLFQKFKDMAGAILVGNGICGLIQGCLGGAAFALFGLRSPFLWGVVMSLLAFLPILGIGVVLIPAAVYLVLTGRIAAGIFFFVFYILVSGGVEYVVKPRLVGKRVQMHTLLVFLSIIGGLKLFGILGIIYGPLVVTGFLTLSDIYRNSYQRLVVTIKNP